MDDRAHARDSDPHTSHEAAEAITPHVRTGREAVKVYFQSKGPGGSTDAQMHFELKDNSSHLRSRRAELVAEGWIVNSGRVAKFDNERDRIVWVHRDFVANPPPLRERPAAPKKEADPLHEEAVALRLQLRQAAESMKREGRAGAQQLFTDAEQMIERLLQS